MKFKSTLFLLIILIIGSGQLFAQTNKQNPFAKMSFDSKTLSYNGQNAYQDLLNTKIFTLSAFGFAAADYPSTANLAILLQEKESEKALQSVFGKANTEGKVYALIGLQIIKSNSFESAFEFFRSNAFEGISSEDGGCDSSPLTLKREEVIKNLESKEYANRFQQRFSHLKFNQSLNFNAPELPLNEIKQKVLKLIKGLKSQKDISPNKIEKIMGIKVVTDKNDNNFGFSGKITDTSWTYNLISLTSFSIKGANVSEFNRLQFFFAETSEENAELQNICNVNYETYKQELTELGFVVEPFYGEHGRLLAWRFTKKSIQIDIETRKYEVNECVKSLLITVNK